MRNYLYLIIVSISVMLFGGCSDRLDESKAEKIIMQTKKFPEVNSIDIQHGLIAYNQDSLPAFYYILERNGMFKIEYLGKGGLFVISYRFRVTPTAEAKKYILKEEDSPQKQGGTGEYMYNTSFKTSETYFDKIKDVHEIPSLNAADVSYSVKVKNFTPFWNYYEDKSHKGPDTIGNRTFGMVKTSEGWKAGH